MTSRPPRVLVVGHGSIARKHLDVVERLAPDAAIGIWMPHRAPAAGEPRFLRHRDEVAAFDADVAIVASPAPMHAEQTALLLELGVDVLIEKPLTATAADAAALAERASKSGRLAMVAYPMRFYEPLRAMRELVAKEIESGTVESLQLRSTSYLPSWRPDSDFRAAVSARRELGGGVLREVSHELDLLHWLAGDAVDIAATVGSSRELDLEVETRAHLVLAMVAGCDAHVHLDMADHRVSRDVRVVTSAATLCWSLADHTVRRFRRGAAGDGEVVFEGTGTDWSGMYEREVAYFLDCAATRRAPAPSLADGARVLRTVEAAERAAATRGREPVA